MHTRVLFLPHIVHQVKIGCEDVETVCPISAEVLEEGEWAARMPCGHYFGRDDLLEVSFLSLSCRFSLVLALIVSLSSFLVFLFSCSSSLHRAPLSQSPCSCYSFALVTLLLLLLVCSCYSFALVTLLLLLLFCSCYSFALVTLPSVHLLMILYLQLCVCNTLETSLYACQLTKKSCVCLLVYTRGSLRMFTCVYPGVLVCTNAGSGCVRITHVRYAATSFPPTTRRCVQ